MKPARRRMVLAALAIAAPLTCLAPALASPDTQPLIVEVWINGRTEHVVAKGIEREGMLWLRSADLLASGVKLAASEIDKDGLVALSTLHDVQTELDRNDQQIHLVTGPSRLLPKIFDLKAGSGLPESTAATGLIGRYELVATVDDFGHARKSTSLGGALGATLFTPWATLSANGFAELRSRDQRAVRLDTTLEVDEPDVPRHWLLGDAISGGVTWSRPVRFAGVQMATDFALRPDISTLPLPDFFGTTALPSTVDVFVNAAKVFETSTGPGPFEIQNIPVITGSGHAQIVVTDALGQQQTIRLPYFTSGALLRKGLSAYAFDAGFLRSGYGIDSFDYRDAVMLATYRYGAADWLTLEGHGELAKDVQLAGAGAALSLGAFGVMQLAAATAASRHQGQQRHGSLASLSFDSDWHPVGFFGSVIATTGDYRDLASLDGTPPATWQLQLGANLNLATMGSFAVSWIEIRRRGEDHTRLTTASYAVSLTDRWYLGASGFYDHANRDWAAELYLSISFDDPLDDGELLGHAVAHTGSHTSMQEVGVTKPVSPDGGFGYRASIATGDIDLVQGEITWIGSHGSVDAALTARDNVLAGRLSAAGAFVFMDNAVFATKSPDGAVALVKTGQPGARVFRENREIARADDDGHVLLTGLTPYTENRISIDPRDYKLSTIVETSKQIVVPQRRSGVIVDLAPALKTPALIVLQTADGSVPPVGAKVTLDNGSKPLVVGRGGEVFILDLNKSVSGVVESERGTCRFTADPPNVLAVGRIPRIGPLTCTQEAAL